MKKKYAWNKEKSESVVLSKLKSFTIKDEAWRAQAPMSSWVVRGWYNETNSFVFGAWDTEEEAREFLNEILNSL